MANKFDDFSRHLAKKSSARSGVKYFGPNIIGAAVATVTSRQKDADSKYADACAGYSGIDYLTCIKTAEWRDSGAPQAIEMNAGLHSPIRLSVGFNSIASFNGGLVQFNQGLARLNSRSGRAHRRPTVRFN